MAFDSEEFSPSETIEIEHTPRHAVFTLEIQDEEGVRRLSLTHEQLIVGSSRDANVVLKDRRVSARHCLLAVSEAGIIVRDLGSRNHTYVNGARIEEAVVTEGMTVVIGHSSLVCVAPVEDEEELAKPGAPLEGIAGRSTAMCRIAAQVRQLASLSAPVLIAGETGVGKELVARALHREGVRRDGPFVALNVASLPRDLVESELFGHERGSFTGAVASRPGAFEQAEGGTLFLDEIGELPIDAQPKLLRALDGYEIRRIGANGSGQRANTRVIAATHVPLLEHVASGRFRRDLYHRLEVFVVEIPALRDRRGDIGPIVDQMLRSMEEELGYRRLTAGAIAALTAHDWPGNVRELQNVVRRAAAIATDPWIEAGTIARALRRASPDRPRIAKVSERTVAEWVRTHHGNVSAAARAAGIPRSTFRKLLDRGDP